MRRMIVLTAALVAACRPLPLYENPPIPSVVGRGELLDSSRGRFIPMMVYGRPGPTRPLAILLPGYGLGHTDYRFLADALARRGYVVAAIQPQRSDDAAVPGGDNLVAKRRPFWLRGIEDVRFVVRRLQRERVTRGGPVLLVGHSHGGDIAMLFATEHPREVTAVFTLDNRRMPMPRLKRPRICSARSSDMSADPGVIPTIADQARLEMEIVPLSAIRHDDMFDGASAAQKAAMVEALDLCLAKKGTMQGRKLKPVQSTAAPTN